MSGQMLEPSPLKGYLCAKDRNFPGMNFSTPANKNFKCYQNPITKLNPKRRKKKTHTPKHKHSTNQKKNLEKGTYLSWSRDYSKLNGPAQFS